MKKTKGLCVFLAAAVLLCTLSVCNTQEDAVQVWDDSDAQPEYLNFFSSASMAGSEVAKYWVERFTEMYDKQVYINFENAAYYADEGLSYRELLETRMESSAPDDLYIINAEDVLEFEKKGYWMDLSGMNFVDNLSEAALYQSTYNGKVFSVPLTFTGFGFAWNVDMLKEHDLTVPQNLEEFLNACETLKNAGILPYGANKGYGLTVPAMCVGLSSLYSSENLEARIAALNSGETPISEYVRNGYDFLAMMIEKGYMDPQQALDTTPQDGDMALFASGGCAFICATVGNIDHLSKNAFRIELTGLPVLAEGCATVYGADKRLCVNPNSEHLETALQFIEMVGTPEALAQSALLERSVSSAKDGGKAEMNGEEALVALLREPGQIPNQDFALHFNTWESIRDIARELCAGTDMDTVCALLDEKQQADLQQYGA